jgi:hypothetical protein
MRRKANGTAESSGAINGARPARTGALLGNLLNGIKCVEYLNLATAEA